MPTVSVSNKSLEEIAASIAPDHQATRLRAKGDSLTVKTGATSLWGRFKDAVRGQTDDKIRQAEAAMVEAFKKSSGGIEPNQEQRQIIADMVRGRGDATVQERLNQLKTGAGQARTAAAEASRAAAKALADAKQKAIEDQYKEISGGFMPRTADSEMIKAFARGESDHTQESLMEHLRPLAEAVPGAYAPLAPEREAKKAVLDQKISELKECRDFGEFEQKFSEVLKAREVLRECEGRINALGGNSHPKQDNNAMNQQVAEAVQQNPHLQGLDKAKAVAVAAYPGKCVDDAGARAFLDGIEADESLSAQEKLEVRDVVLRFAAREACLNSKDMYSLARSNDGCEKLLAQSATKELSAMGHEVVMSMNESPDAQKAFDLAGGSSNVPKPTDDAASSELKEAYRDVALVGIQAIVDKSPGVAPESKQALAAMKQGGIEAAKIKPSLLVEGATPEELGNQLVGSQVTLRAVNPIITKQAVAARANPNLSAQAKAAANLVFNASAEVQRYDNSKMQAGIPDSKGVVADMRQAKPELLEQYRNVANALTAVPGVKVEVAPELQPQIEPSPKIESVPEVKASSPAMKNRDKLQPPPKVKPDGPQVNHEVAPEQQSFKDKRAMFEAKSSNQQASEKPKIGQQYRPQGGGGSSVGGPGLK